MELNHSAHFKYTVDLDKAVFGSRRPLRKLKIKYLLEFFEILLIIAKSDIFYFTYIIHFQERYRERNIYQNFKF